MKPREFKWSGFYPKYTRYVNLSQFLSAYTTVESICNAINSLELMSGPASAINSSFSSADAASVFSSSLISDATGAKLMDSSNLTASKAALILDHENFSLSKMASIFNHTEVAIPRGADILDHANLTSSRLRSLFIQPDLSDTRRIEFTHSWGRLASKVPSLSGVWEVSPSSLSRITDASPSTTCTNGEVFSPAPNLPETGYITIDIGALSDVKVITLKYSGHGSGNGYSYIKIAHSPDNTVWTQVVSNLIQDTTLAIDASIRYVRLEVYAKPITGQQRTYLDSCYFVLG